jgi:hypothetical protein
MKQRYWLFKRGKTFYVQDSQTKEQKSLGTKDKAEALRLLEVKIQSAANPAFSRALLNACITAHDPEYLSRTWQTVMDQMVTHGKPQSKARALRAFRSNDLKLLARKKLLETTSSDFLRIVSSNKCSTQHYLRRLHNLAVGLGWLPFPILPPKLWPKPVFRQKRALTAEEHQRILAAEQNLERRQFYQFLWETGAAQSDAAGVQCNFINWLQNTISFQRKKTGTWCHIVIGKF